MPAPEPSVAQPDELDRTAYPENLEALTEVLGLCDVMLVVKVGGRSLGIRP